MNKQYEKQAILYAFNIPTDDPNTQIIINSTLLTDKERKSIDKDIEKEINNSKH